MAVRAAIQRRYTCAVMEFAETKEMQKLSDVG